MTVEWIGPAWLRRPAEALGVRIFHRATRLSLVGPIYTDAAVEHICHLTDLQLVTLEGTAISDQGIARLRRELPHCRIELIKAATPTNLANHSP
ncbi:MAG: hypothetical protein L0211_10860 [Planctomycetaceae bacterium]|nr:hypothetical protein [Planctomycetaceae bacterium]